jgi:hypothetical protein
MPGKLLPPRWRRFAPPENRLEKTNELFAAAYPPTRYSSTNAVCRTSLTIFPSKVTARPFPSR